MKIKIFSTWKSNLEELEIEVNKWLTENKIEVFDMSLTSTSDSPEVDKEYVIVVRYDGVLKQ